MKIFLKDLNWGDKNIMENVKQASNRVKKVLFIEDEDSLQKTLTMALRADGYEVESAYDGEEGLILAMESNPDIILLDLILPKMNGFTVLEKIKESKKLDEIPILVLTNLEDTEDVQKVVGLGATSYLVKANYNVEDIAQKVKEALGD